MFQAVDMNGVAIPNTYLILQDYTGINYDYQDNVFVVEGITPVFSGTATATLSSALAKTSSASLQGTGEATDDRLLGDAGANHLRGWGGDDVLMGGRGEDHLSGGAGEIRLREVRAGVLVELNVDDDARPELAILVRGGGGLDAGDFVL
ncbi:hypothetical protein Rumeso_02379 [Rubellimicrobium mesophilum DSM 19309]|uniref:Alkaline phosphatase n=1 Tax=Rubellimicrobium mesophilum DSM 19309 TaxID=442562 RepID=A0A017HNR1_9RHOB|nr:hypothetical protein Rumeso_02379 [Rubellimicrobium mesophilum DSM 19309]